jgi:hypothetical protein
MILSIDGDHSSRLRKLCIRFAVISWIATSLSARSSCGPLHAFPRFDFRQKSPEWHDWQIINRSKLTSAPISRIILGILAQGRDLLASAGLACANDQARHASAERCEAASRMLRPRFEYAMSPKARRKELDDDLLRLTDEQFTALDQASLNPRVVFSGPAGAGKTVLAMEALRREDRGWFNEEVGTLLLHEASWRRVGQESRRKDSGGDSWPHRCLVV